MTGDDATADVSVWRDSDGVVHTVAYPGDPADVLPPPLLAAFGQAISDDFDGVLDSLQYHLDTAFDDAVDAVRNAPPDEIPVRDDPLDAPESDELDLAETPPLPTLPAMLTDALAEWVTEAPARDRILRIEALQDLSYYWSDLASDTEKLLGHLLLTHGHDLERHIDLDELPVLHIELHRELGAWSHDEP